MSTDGLRILITNNTLGSRAGSELFVRDLAIGLMRRGHRPIVFSTVLGEVAELLGQATVPVVDDLDALTAVPDVIHGQHHLETMMAVQHFPHTPAVHVCHGWLPWEEQPVAHPGIRRHVAVDDLCAERLHTTKGIDPARVLTVYNGVDLDRFQPRAPLPDRPRTALVFSNYTGTDSPRYDAIRSACLSRGITRVDIAGSRSGQISRLPESLLGDYDVVFAKARCALEAMAVGCAVVVTDYAGLGGLVTMDNVHALRRLNFGARTMQASQATEAAIAAELDRYSKHDAARVSDWIRRDAPFHGVVDRFVSIYRDTIAEGCGGPTEEASMAAAAYLRLLSPRIKALGHAELRAHTAHVECMTLKSQMAETLQREQSALLALADADSRADSANAECAAARSRLESMEEHGRTTQQSHAAQTREIADLQSRLLASEAEARRSADETCSLERHLAAFRERLPVLEAEIGHSATMRLSLETERVELRARLDQASNTLHEIHRSRAWRAVTAYRRLRAFLG